mmetsp:Transcript_16397/g.42969  ORF Transcript_16397/g.42969 Transcript_16397/m.42969 type:complete len:125 (-) Transcript_16397:35-409(-)
MREKATKKRLYSRSRLAKAAVASAAKDVKLDMKRAADGREKCESARTRCVDRAAAEHAALVAEVEARMEDGGLVWEQARDKLAVWNAQYVATDNPDGGAVRLLGGGGRGAGFDGLSATLGVLLG